MPTHPPNMYQKMHLHAQYNHRYQQQMIVHVRSHERERQRCSIVHAPYINHQQIFTLEK
jgi:hypothetical protein